MTYVWRADWPKYLHQFKEIKGICYGGCVLCTGFKNELAHAHCDVNSFNGWICLKYKSYLKNRKLMIHEVAHLYSGWKNGHNDAWRRNVIELGGSLDPFVVNRWWQVPSFHKKPKVKNAT